jgi:polyisoprenoid-binding protein YceI
MANDQLRRRFTVDPNLSALLLQSRSNIGAVQFGTREVTGYLDVAIGPCGVAIDRGPVARLEVALAELTSGNALYDDELRQRLDVRRFPVATVELEQAHALPDDTYRVSGLVTLHGIAAQLQGSVRLVLAETGELTVTGEQVVDIRDFDIDVPSVLMLRIYPDVKVALHLVAHEVRDRPVL